MSAASAGELGPHGRPPSLVSGGADPVDDAVYDELKRIARHYLRARVGGATLSTTDLVHDAYLKFGALPEARANLEQAYAIRRRLIGDSHPEVAASVAGLARLHQLAARYAEAEGGYRRALAVQRARLGDTAAATQRTVFELATVLHAAGRLREAGPLFAEWERLATARAWPRDAARARQLDDMGEYLAARALPARHGGVRARGAILPRGPRHQARARRRAPRGDRRSRSSARRSTSRGASTAR